MIGNRLRLAAALQRLTAVFLLVGNDERFLSFSQDEMRKFGEISMRHILNACYGEESVITDEDCEFFERLATRYEEALAGNTGVESNAADAARADAAQVH